MKLVDFRFVERQSIAKGEVLKLRILQVRHRSFWIDGFGVIHTSNVSREEDQEWGDWEDVPLVRVWE